MIVSCPVSSQQTINYAQFSYCLIYFFNTHDFPWHYLGYKRISLLFYFENVSLFVMFFFFLWSWGEGLGEHRDTPDIIPTRMMTAISWWSTIPPFPHSSVYFQRLTIRFSMFSQNEDRQHREDSLGDIAKYRGVKYFHDVDGFLRPRNQEFFPSTNNTQWRGSPPGGMNTWFLELHYY